MTQEIKTIINPSLPAFLREFQEAVQHGWEIDENNGPKMWGIAYETGLVRTDKTVAAMVARIQDGEVVKPPLTRAETLERARAAKAEKRASNAVQQ